MKTCPLCQKSFPSTYIKIDGKGYNISKRVYCLDCSPFKKHNTTRIHSPETMKRKHYPKTHNVLICQTCQKELGNEDFYKRTDGRLHSHCKKCFNIASMKQQNIRKKTMVDFKGGKCVVCGYDRYEGALEFHHLDPDKKEFQLSKNLSLDNPKVIEELEKCILLCANCHREIHAGITSYFG